MQKEEQNSSEYNSSTEPVQCPESRDCCITFQIATILRLHLQNAHCDCHWQPPPVIFIRFTKPLYRADKPLDKTPCFFAQLRGSFIALGKRSVRTRHILFGSLHQQSNLDVAHEI